MATGSKKGACSAHVDAAKANCLKHDRREGNIPSYVNPHLTHTNRTVFEDEMIRGRKSITPLVNRAEKLYTEKTGQKCQKSFAPFREDVLRLKAGITDEQLMAFKNQVEKATGWKVIGVWLHQDEGHYHSKYIEGDENYDINYHAHVLYSCQDQETGKAIRLGRNYFRLRQDWLAAATGMERGNSAAETGIRGRTAREQRIKAQEERIAQLERIHTEDKAKMDALKDELNSLSRAKVAKEAAIDSTKAVGTWIAGKFGLTEKDKTIEGLQQQVRSLTISKDEAVKAKEAAEKSAKAAATNGYNKALSDIRKQTRLNWPQWEGTSLQGIVSKVNDEVDAHKTWYRHAQESDRKVAALERQINQGAEQNQGLHR